MSRDRFIELMTEAREMSDSPAKVVVLEEAIRIADAHNAISAGVGARMALVHAGIFGGAEEKALVAFSWLLARFDEDPNVVNAFQLHWRYKWIVGHAPDFPTISAERVKALEDDIERRYLELGYGLRVVHSLRADNALLLGDFDRVRHYFELWKGTERDALSDCEACEVNTHSKLLAELGQFEESLAVAQPLLDGRLTCHTMPETTFGQILYPLLQVGNEELAAECHRRGYRQVLGRPNYLLATSGHLGYMVAQREHSRAIRCLERQVPIAIQSSLGAHRLEAFASFLLCLESLCENGKTKTRKFRLPDEVAVDHDEEGRYELTALRDWLQAEVNRLGGQFDARNGNSYISESIQQRQKTYLN